MKDTEKNHIDEWLQKQIKKGINTIESVSKGTLKVRSHYTTQDIYKKTFTIIFQVELVKRYLKGIETI